jgi:hypothetical protein
MSSFYSLCIAMSMMFAAFVGSSAPANPDIVLHGTVKGEQNNTYIEVPFEVPPGVARLTVSFQYTGKEQHTTLDLGIEDPQRLRGWSGGNKSTFTIGTSDATPSYLPGVIVPGTWKLLIGVPNIRRESTATYRANIYFQRALANKDPEEFSSVPLRETAGWYRGDLHMHTAHSDGQCNSQSGKRVPCPVFLTLDVAVRRGLDFIAVTDHNATSQYDDLRELQPYFDQLLLIPGREITTFVGHANLFGPTDFLDFRVGSSSVPDMNSLLRRAHELNALVSINHPGAPTGEICMGCGWTSKSTDMSLVNAIEAVNGGSEKGPYSGIPFWEQQLNRGNRVTAIGGSDNHNAQLPLQKPSSVGSPTTVIYAPELSVKGILAGIRSGRVFVDLTASKDRLLDFSVETSGRKAEMGATLQAAPGETVALAAHVDACQGSRLRILIDGREDSTISAMPIVSADQTLNATWRSDGQHHWVRADVISDTGKLQLLGNPVYVNFVQNRTIGQ